MTGLLPVSLVSSSVTPLEGGTAAIGLLSVLQVGLAASLLRAESMQPPDSCSVFRIHLKHPSVYWVGAPCYTSPLPTTFPIKFITLVVSCAKSSFLMR